MTPPFSQTVSSSIVLDVGRGDGERVSSCTSLDDLERDSDVPLGMERKGWKEGRTPEKHPSLEL
jgi:hypothetical protein